MKLGFWTLGMPAWPVDELVGRADKLGYDGIDLRCTRAVDHKPANGGYLSIESSREEIESVRRAFAASGVEIASLICYHPMGHEYDAEDWDWYKRDLAEHAHLATAVGTGRIRVMAGRPRLTSWDEHLDALWTATADALSTAPGIEVVFENHPGSAGAGQLLAAAARGAHPRIGVEFSPDHCMTMQENPLDLIERFAPQIFQVCVADRAVIEEGLADFDGRYYHVRYEATELGHGIVPAGSVFRLLAEAGFDGYLSLKWEKGPTMGEQLPPGEEALLHYLEFMQQFGITAARRISK